MTEAQLRRQLALALPHTSAPVINAVVDVRARRRTWRDAAIDNGCTESAIYHALKRAKKAMQYGQPA